MEISFKQAETNANELIKLVASDTRTGQGGYVEKFVFSDIGEQRQWGTILHHMATLAYVTSPSLVSQRNLSVNADCHKREGH